MSTHKGSYSRVTDYDAYRDHHDSIFGRKEGAPTPDPRALPVYPQGECPDCGALQPVERFTPTARGQKPFKVTLYEDQGKTVSVDASSISMARAAACGFPNARILISENENTPQ